MHADAALSQELRDRIFPGARFSGPANVLVFANSDAASGVRNILKMKANGLEVGPILMGMGNRAHIVTPSITARGLAEHRGARRHAGRALRLKAHRPRHGTRGRRRAAGRAVAARTILPRRHRGPPATLPAPLRTGPRRDPDCPDDPRGRRDHRRASHERTAGRRDGGLPRAALARLSHTCGRPAVRWRRPVRGPNAMRRRWSGGGAGCIYDVTSSSSSSRPSAACPSCRPSACQPLFRRGGLPPPEPMKSR